MRRVCVTTEFFLPFDPTRLQTLFGIFARLQDDGEHTDDPRISGGKVGGVGGMSACLRTKYLYTVTGAMLSFKLFPILLLK